MTDTLARRPIGLGDWIRSTDRPGGTLPGLELIARRELVRSGPVIWFDIDAGDRPLVRPGDAIHPGTPLAERLRDARMATAPAGETGLPGSRWHHIAVSEERSKARRRVVTTTGELLYEHRGAWRVGTGDQVDILEAPVAGIVRDVQPGVGIALGVAGVGVPGILVIGGPARGRLEIAAAAEGELRPAAIDVGRAGSILVVGSRVEAETLTRARAMGIRGVVVGALPGKDLRDFTASEARQRASLHALSPFAVLALDGYLRRPIASPVMAILSALAGKEVAIAGDPPMLLVDAPGIDLPAPPPDLVRVKNGDWAGREGRWAGLAGRRRFATGSHLDAGLVAFDGERGVAFPLADLERFV